MYFLQGCVSAFTKKVNLIINTSKTLFHLKKTISKIFYKLVKKAAVITINILNHIFINVLIFRFL
ncbi:hypothetical protein ULMA_05150 [Patiriisocius marinus]|uniref:Uncharacterized protein n=1 Tax=Patiriisocius marinus TaxID=1397112 RepID=A0A5J4J1N2_9FLAO|nr:hypothetical protein ULMA_05150 [Patiriisocius marinus]